MEDLSIGQVIEFAISIEEESHAFYTEAVARLKEPGVRPLAEELAAAEVDHLNRIRKLRNLDSVTAKDLDHRVRLETEDYRNVVATGRIEDSSSAEDILGVALAREEATARTYQTLVSMTDLAADVVELFAYLTKQEQGHVTAIEHKLEEL